MTSSTSALRWNTATTERLNVRFDIVPDADVGTEDWPAAMADPALVDEALAHYDSAAATDDERALIVEWMFSTFEYCSIERDGNPDWRRFLDRLERDLDEHQEAVRRWAEPEDGNPWLISLALKAILARPRFS